MKYRIQFVVLLLLLSASGYLFAQQTSAGNEPLPPPPANLLPQRAQEPAAAPAAGAQIPAPVAYATQTPQSAATQPPDQPVIPQSSEPQASGPQLKQNPLELLREFEPASDEEYRLGRGDEITVDFTGRPDLLAKLVIGPDGRITLPLAGDLMLAGLTRPDAAKAIQAALSSYYENLAVQVTVTKYTSNRVLVLGAVTTPGEFNFEGTPTLLAALTRAGLVTGLDRIARVPEQCAIYRGNQQVVWVQLKQLIESGNSLADLRLRRGDVIYVPNMMDRFVSVLGEVKNPGAVPLTSSSTLASVLAQVGGLNEVAGGNAHIQIVDPATGNSRMVRFQDILRPGKSSEVTLKPGQIIFVPKSGFGKATYILQRLSPAFALSNFAYLGACYEPGIESRLHPDCSIQTGRSSRFFAVAFAGFGPGGAGAFPVRSAAQPGDAPQAGAGDCAARAGAGDRLFLPQLAHLHKPGAGLHSADALSGGAGRSGHALAV